MKSRFLIIVVALTVAMLGGCGGGRSGVVVLDNEGVIAYHSSPCIYSPCEGGEQPNDFFLINPDGTNRRSQGNIRGVLSPDGRYLAYVSSGYRSFGGLGITDLQSGQPVNFTAALGVQETLGGGNFIWHPDSRRVLFLIEFLDVQRSYQNKKILFNVASLQGEEYTGPEFYKWFPDGRRVLSRAENNEAPGFYIRSLDGSPSQRVPNTENSRFADISPDGSTIAFDANRGGNIDIYLQSVDGRNLKRLTTDAAIEDQPAFSPNGRKIAFRRVIDVGGPGGAGSLGNIWTMNIDGSNQLPLTSDNISSNPQWVLSR